MNIVYKPRVKKEFATELTELEKKTTKHTKPAKKNATGLRDIIKICRSWER